jgi:hypothetical protein
MATVAIILDLERKAFELGPFLFFHSQTSQVCQEMSWRCFLPTLVKGQTPLLLEPFGEGPPLTAKLGP